MSDTGKGINADFLLYIFEYFRQADNTITRKFGGLGLGFAIVRNLAELHSGFIEAESVGKGLRSTFTIRLSLPKNECETMKNDLYHPLSSHLNEHKNEGYRLECLNGFATTMSVARTAFGSVLFATVLTSLVVMQQSWAFL